MSYYVFMSEQNGNLLDFIASTVEAMRDQMATKADLIALKEQMATKAELAALKDDLFRIESKMATKAELAAVKADLSNVKKEMATKVDIVAIRGDLEQVHLRLDSIDRALSGRMGLVESEVSRLRSVLYLLVKEKPDLLRLLGQSSLQNNRPPS